MRGKKPFVLFGNIRNDIMALPILAAVAGVFIGMVPMLQSVAMIGFLVLLANQFLGMPKLWVSLRIAIGVIVAASSALSVGGAVGAGIFYGIWAPLISLNCVLSIVIALLFAYTSIRDAQMYQCYGWNDRRLVGTKRF